eukprot:gnl/Spiro4/3899_TR1930_c0_g1_i1.p1 gnl/Spiro4/3899_TR1930_c0_g1~~gnl/Spiro4/3899_TR1930_c0_g1_i1.p1  ORF type:complete len:191 (+),score=39.54 gnl/Spiro4/3899_TR1930_c0_g1_i1:40-573(+)
MGVLRLVCVLLAICLLFSIPTTCRRKRKVDKETPIVESEKHDDSAQIQDELLRKLAEELQADLLNSKKDLQVNFEREDARCACAFKDPLISQLSDEEPDCVVQCVRLSGLERDSCPEHTCTVSKDGAENVLQLFRVSLADTPEEYPAAKECCTKFGENAVFADDSEFVDASASKGVF